MLFCLSLLQYIRVELPQWYNGLFTALRCTNMQHPASLGRLKLSTLYTIKHTWKKKSHFAHKQLIYDLLICFRRKVAYWDIALEYSYCRCIEIWRHFSCCYFYCCCCYLFCFQINKYECSLKVPLLKCFHWVPKMFSHRNKAIRFVFFL